MNWWFLIRLGWVIPLCIIGFYVLLGISVILLPDVWITYLIIKVNMAKTTEEKAKTRKILHQILEIKLNLQLIKYYIKKIFKK